jgi:hypothetical protein
MRQTSMAFGKTGIPLNGKEGRPKRAGGQTMLKIDAEKY